MRTSSSLKRSVRSILEKLEIRVWPLVLEPLVEVGVGIEGSCIAKTTCFKGLVFLSQRSDQLCRLFFNSELGSVIGSSAEIDIEVLRRWWCYCSYSLALLQVYRPDFHPLFLSLSTMLSAKSLSFALSLSLRCYY